MPNAAYSVVGKATQPAPHSKFESAFNRKVSYFENTVIFQQKVKLNSDKGMIHGKLEYMTCNDQKCLPPEELDFTLSL